jgi:iron complex outermembrane receptor protein
MQQQQNKSERYRTKDRVRLAQTRDQQFDFDTYGAYVQAEIKPFESLKIVPAYRVDKIQGDFTNEMTGMDYDINDYGLIKQPKLSVVYSPWKVASIYANWGRTFQVGPARRPTRFRHGTGPGPSINEGWKPGSSSPRQLDRAAWRIGNRKPAGEVSRRLNDPSGESDNVGETRRWGYDAQVNLHPNERTDIWMAYSWQYSKILQPSACPTAKARKSTTSPITCTTPASATRPPALQLTAWMNGQTNYYLERENTGHLWRLRPDEPRCHLPGDRVGECRPAKNLTNRYYEYVWYDPDGAQASLHSPGDGRALYTGVTLDF